MNGAIEVTAFYLGRSKSMFLSTCACQIIGELCSHWFFKGRKVRHGALSLELVAALVFSNDFSIYFNIIITF